MATLKAMESVLEQFSPILDLMQDAKRIARGEITTENISAARSSSADPEMVKQILNTYNSENNDYSQIALQIDAIKSQTKAIRNQTKSLHEQGDLLEDMHAAQDSQTEAISFQTKAIRNQTKALHEQGDLIRDMHDAQEAQIEAISFQTKAISSHTEIMHEQVDKLDDISLTLTQLHDLLDTQFNTLSPKIQSGPPDALKDWVSRMEQQKYAQQQTMLLQQILEQLQMQQMLGDSGLDFGDNAKKRFGSLKNGAQRAFSYIRGLGAGAMGGFAQAGGAGGWRSRLGKAALGVGAAAIGYKGLESLGGLGSVSALEESGNKGVDAISDGKGDAGGVSYGTYQLSSKTGTMDKFLRSDHAQNYASDFVGLTPGTAAFNEAYKNVVARDREGFAKAQENFMKETHYDPLARKVAKDTGLDVSQRSRALQELVFSTSTQYGGNTGVISRALQGRDVNSMTDAELISTIQDNKRDNVAGDFRSSSRNTQESVYDRTMREKDLLLRILADEERNANQTAQQKHTAASEVVAAQSSQPVGIFPIAKTDISNLPTVTNEVTPTDAAGMAVAATGVAKAGTDILGAPSGIGEAGLKRTALRSIPVVGNIALGGMEAAEILTNDKMSKEEKQRGLVGVGGGMAGASTGAAAGAAIGSVIPGPGTLLGGIIGGGIGYVMGENGAKIAMDSIVGTPEERAGRVDGNYPTPNGITLPSVKDLMAVDNAVPAKLMETPSFTQPLQTQSPEISPTSPASTQFYKSEPTISQKPQATQSQTFTQSVQQSAAAEPTQRNQYDTVQNVRLAVDQPPSPAAPVSTPSSNEKSGGKTGSDRPTLDEIPALINDFGLIFVNSGFL